MTKDNLIIYVSSKNNYDMLSKEVLKNISFEGFEFINVDDNSENSEIEKGQRICKENGIQFLANKKKGVQWATQTLLDFINDHRPNCKWIFCFQHDNFPKSRNFFNYLSKLINSKKVENFGIIGFNHLDNWEYSLFSKYLYFLGFNPSSMIGIGHLSALNNRDSILTKRTNFFKLMNPKWKKPFIIEFPIWPSIGLNVKLWNQIIKPTEELIFHLWLPDVAMQFLEKGKFSLVIPHLYCFNNQKLKEKYGINKNSAIGAKNGEEKHFGPYSNFEYWKKKWGWDFEKPKKNASMITNKYFRMFIEHDLSKGPLKNIDL